MGLCSPQAVTPRQNPKGECNEFFYLKIKLMLFKTQWNSDLFVDDPTNGEVNNEPSMTIPDQSMSIEEIVTRFASGEPISVGQDVYYETDEVNASFSDVDPTMDPSFDLSDYSAMRSELSQRKARKEADDARTQDEARTTTSKPNEATIPTDIAEVEGKDPLPF